MEIFVAEDEADVTITYKIALEDKKHRIIVKGSGQHCLEVYNEITKYSVFDKNYWLYVLGG